MTVLQSRAHEDGHVGRSARANLRLGSQRVVGIAAHLSYWREPIVPNRAEEAQQDGRQQVQARGADRGGAPYHEGMLLESSCTANPAERRPASASLAQRDTSLIQRTSRIHCWPFAVGRWPRTICNPSPPPRTATAHPCPSLPHRAFLSCPALRVCTFHLHSAPSATSPRLLLHAALPGRGRRAQPLSAAANGSRAKADSPGTTLMQDELSNYRAHGFAWAE